jgi:hypothetical protein
MLPAKLHYITHWTEISSCIPNFTFSFVWQQYVVDCTGTLQSPKLVLPLYSSRFRGFMFVLQPVFMRVMSTNGSFILYILLTFFLGIYILLTCFFRERGGVHVSLSRNILLTCHSKSRLNHSV